MSEGPTSPIYIRNSDVIDIEQEVAARYTVGQILGTGAYGTVYSAVDTTNDQSVAVKIISKKRLGHDGAVRVEREVRVMETLDHPCILRMLDFIPSPNFYNIVMERADGGELFGHLIRMSKYTERKACRVTHNLLRALRHMHEKGYMHCDLKPENLLLVRAPLINEEVTSIKLADFGLAQALQKESMPTKCCGSPLYMAPEILQVGFQKTRPSYDEKADMWSAGVVVYLLLSGLIPFFGRTPNEIFKTILTTQHNFTNAVWESVSDEAKDFINRLFEKDPAKRLSADEALAHPWMKLSAEEDSEGDLELQGSLERIQLFNAEQKLKGAVFGVEATFRLAYLSGCQTKKLKANSRLVELLTSTMTVITSIDLSNNYLGSNGLKALSEALCSSSSVTTLNLTNVLLDDAQLESLVQFFAQEQCKLRTLHVDMNNLTHTGGRILLALARRQPHLTTITATRNHIKESILEHIQHVCSSNMERQVEQTEPQFTPKPPPPREESRPQLLVPQLLTEKVVAKHAAAIPEPVEAGKVFHSANSASLSSSVSVSGISTAPSSVAKGYESPKQKRSFVSQKREALAAGAPMASQK